MIPIMANYQASKSVHKTLSGTSADTVEITGGFPAIEVVNRTGTDAIYVVVGSPGSVPSVPVSAADNLEVVLPNERLVISLGQTTPSVSKYVRVVGVGNGYSVIGTVVR